MTRIKASRINEIKKAMKTKRPPLPEISKELLSTGSGVLNLACSGKINGGFPKGTIILLVGDSDSGKTFLSLTCLAEAAQSKAFEDYDFIFDGPEFGALMDMERFFGRKVVRRLHPPRVKKGEPIHSALLEEFYYNVQDRLDAGKPFIYVLDSIDGFDTEADEDKFNESREAFKDGKDASGSYGTSAAKINSRRLRSIANQLPKTGSILIIISQSRDNLMGRGKSRAGGRALKFYSAIEMWTSVLKELKTNYKGKDRQLGILAEVRVKRSRITGKHRVVTVPIYHSFGIDDIGGMVDFLIEERIWKKTKGKIKAGEFEFVGTREKVVQHIESESLVRELKDLVKETWNGIEKKLEVKRSKRYE